MQRPSVRRRLRERWIAAILHWHRTVLIVAALVTALALHLTLRLRVDNDLRALLPADDPALVELVRVEASLGALGSVNIIVDGGTREDRHHLADELAARIEASPRVRDVEHRVDGEFFAEHALYYLAANELERLGELLEAWQHAALCQAEPGLCLEPPDPGAEAALRGFLRRQEATARARSPFHDYLEHDGIPALVLLVHPVERASDLEFARLITAELRASVAEVQARTPGAEGLRVNLVGPYIVQADEHATIRRDMLRGGVFGVLGVLLILQLLLRSLRAVVTLMLPLACGVLWSMACAQLVLGHLNSLTSLISTVIMGMGIDAGIHFLLRVRREPAEVPDGEAIARAFNELLTPLLVASATTLAAFCVMAGSAFPAFREFGLIAASGVVLCLLAMVTVFPAALRLGGLKRVASRRSGAVVGPLVTAALRRPDAALALVVGLTAAAYVGAGQVQFERNSREFQSDRTRAEGEADAFLIREIFGHDIHAGVLLVDSLGEARQVLATARRAVAHAGDRSLVADLFAAPDLLPDPAIDPLQRRRDIEALAEQLPRSFDAHLAAGDLARLQRMVRAKPVTIERLPPALRVKVVGADGRFPVYAFPAYDAADITLGAGFMTETASFTSGPGGLGFVGEMTVYARMYRMTMDEAPLVLGLSAGLITLVVLAQLRSLAATLRTLLPLALGVVWMIGLMGALDLRFTLFNVPILPVILGVGVDNGVYLSDQLRRTGGSPNALAGALAGTGAAILAATATTAVGFAAFMIADNGGLRSIGQLAVLGVLIAALAAVLVLPALAGRGGRGEP